MKRIFSTISIAITLLFISQIAASAHAGLVSANPAANSEVHAMPKVISLTFTEDLMQIKGKNINSISLSYMEHPDLGHGIALANEKVDGATLSATLPVGQYRTGKYVVSYSIVSADGHKVSDIYSFTVVSISQPLQEITPTPQPVAGGNGVLPLPIVGAIVIVVALGGLFAYRARSRKS